MVSITKVLSVLYFTAMWNQSKLLNIFWNANVCVGNILLVFTCKRVQLWSGNFSFLGLGRSKEVGSMHFDIESVFIFQKKKNIDSVLSLLLFLFLYHPHLVWLLKVFSQIFRAWKLRMEQWLNGSLKSLTNAYFDLFFISREFLANLLLCTRDKN